jgi:hypothetical protein
MTALVLPSADPIAPDRAIADALDGLLTDEKNRDGRRILAYALPAELRSILQVRLYKLQAALVPGEPGHLAQIVAQMLLGFSSARVSETNAEAIVTQYVTVLTHLPLWAVQKACKRFAAGRVTKTECPDWKLAYAPSTAHLCRVAEASVHEHWCEEIRINAALNGIPVYVPSEEERKRVEQGFKTLTAYLTHQSRKQPKQWMQPISVAASEALKRTLLEQEETRALLSDGAR